MGAATQKIMRTGGWMAGIWKLDRSVLLRMFSESMLIIVSILLALSADTWIDTRRQAAERDGHLAALARDFGQMLERVDASYDSAMRGWQAGVRLSTRLQAGDDIDPAAARELIWHLIFYEVFSPSVGAYEALVSSGNLELLDNDELKLELANFFGSFDDVRASERLQLDTQVELFATATFSRLVGWHRMGQAEIPVAGDMPTAEWAASDELMNGIGILTERQYDVLDDYDYLRTRIRNIAAAIASERSER